VFVDPAMVRQVIVNLILNAVQAIARCQAGRITLSTRLHQGEVLCQVCDSGPGVNQADAETIFKPFFTSKPRGTGLGLSISRRLIELQFGRLWLKNPGHQGACFAFSVRVATAFDACPGEPAGPRPYREPA
jgi:signal transduction histidine kinase